MLGYPDIAAAGDAVPQILPHQPWQLEGMDQVLIQLEKQAHLAGDGDASSCPSGGGWLMIAVRRRRPGRRRREGAGAARRRREATTTRRTSPFLDDPAKEDEAGRGPRGRPRRHRPPPRPARDLGGLGGRRRPAGPARRLPARLPCAAGRLRLRQGRDLPVRALRPGLRAHPDPVRAAHRRRASPHYRAFVERAADLVVSYGGSLSGEHGDGQSRGELLPKMFGPEVVGLFGRGQGRLRPRQPDEPRQGRRPEPAGPAAAAGAPTTRMPSRRRSSPTRTTTAGSPPRPCAASASAPAATRSATTR